MTNELLGMTRVPSVASSAYVPALSMLRLENVASPDASVATGVAPERTPGPPCAVSAMVTPLTGLPPLSVTRTTTGGAMTVPAGVFTGCCVNNRVTPVPPALVRAKLAGVATPATEAVTA